ncbi:hypothetical protein [Micromonospora sp. CPCC 206061]|uniref:hypothetical protein n=1 Tax=Micromonospora sp. CPCC 206061 TaxID=3122410 RepID=UPI002FF259E6
MTTNHLALMLPGAEQWCQRWRRGDHSWRPTSEGGFDPARYTVAPLRTAPVGQFIAQHHYSRSRASTVLGYVLVDLWPDPDPDAQWLDLQPLRRDCLPEPGRAHKRGQIVGALTLGNPMNRFVLPATFPGLTPYKQALELNRLVLLDRVLAPAESWFCARSLRLAGRLGVRGVLAYCDPVGRHRIQPDGTVEILTPGHCGTVYAAMSGRQLKRGRARVHLLLPDGTTLVGRSASKIVGGERGAQGVIQRLIKLGATAPKPGTDLTAWFNGTLKDLGVVEYDHPGNYKFAWPTGPRKQRRRVDIRGVVDGPYPTHIFPSVAVPTGRPR